MGHLKEKFICATCGKILWITYDKGENGNYFCRDCFKKFDKSNYENFVVDLLLKHAFATVDAFIRKYGVDYNDSDFDKLKKLLVKKYEIG